MASDNVVQVTDSSFDTDVLGASVPVLVDFWAVWCGPCKAIAPLLDQIAEDKAGAVKIAKVDVDKNPGTAMRFGVRNIPTLLLFKDGQVVGQRVGALNKSALESFLASAD